MSQPGYVGLAGRPEGPDYAGPILRVIQVAVAQADSAEFLADYIYDGPAHFWAACTMAADNVPAGVSLLVEEDVGVSASVPLAVTEWPLYAAQSAKNIDLNEASVASEILHLPPRRMKIRIGAGLLHGATWWAALVPLYLAQNDGTIVPRIKSNERG